MIHFAALKEMGKIFTDTTTLADGVTFDMGRVMGFLGTFVYFGLAIYSVVWQHEKFSMMDYGAGFGAMAVGLGGMLNLKHKTEPGSTTASTISVSSPSGAAASTTVTTSGDSNA